MGYIGRLAQRALDFVVVAVANEHQRVALPGKFDGFKMDFRHQRAGGVNHLEITAFAAFPNRRRNSMSTVDHALAVGDVVNVVDEDCALFRQLIHNIAVMDDLAAHINGGAEGLKSNLYNVDGADHTGAKAAWLKEQNLFHASGSASGAVMGNGFDDRCGHISKYTNGRVETTGQGGLDSWFADSCFPHAARGEGSGTCADGRPGRARRGSHGPSVPALAGFEPIVGFRLWLLE